jgi:hypothetical protein
MLLQRRGPIPLQTDNSIGAPMNEQHRERWKSEGLALQRPDVPLAGRIRGAERWLVAMHHEHFVKVLLGRVQRMDLRSFFTKYETYLTGNFDDEVKAYLRYEYSDAPWYGAAPCRE